MIRWYALTVAAALGPVCAPEADRVVGLEQTLLSLEHRGWEAVMRQDWGALKGLMADDFRAVSCRGGRRSRAEFLAALAHLRLRSYELDQVSVLRLSEEAAVLTYRATAELAAGARSWRETMWVSQTWVLRGGRWVNVLYQETPLRRGPRPAPGIRQQSLMPPMQHPV